MLSGKPVGYFDNLVMEAAKYFDENGKIIGRFWLNQLTEAPSNDPLLMLAFNMVICNDIIDLTKALREQVQKTASPISRFLNQKFKFKIV